MTPTDYPFIVTVVGWLGMGALGAILVAILIDVRDDLRQAIQLLARNNSLAARPPGGDHVQTVQHLSDATPMKANIPSSMMPWAEVENPEE